MGLDGTWQKSCGRAGMTVLWAPWSRPVAKSTAEVLRRRPGRRCSAAQPTSAHPKPRFCGGDCVRVGQGNGQENSRARTVRQRLKVPVACAADMTRGIRARVLIGEVEQAIGFATVLQTVEVPSPHLTLNRSLDRNPVCGLGRGV
jgi:hypothetical protein